MSIPKRPMIEIRFFRGLDYDTDANDMQMGTSQEQTNIRPRLSTMKTRMPIQKIVYNTENVLNEQ